MQCVPIVLTNSGRRVAGLVPIFAVLAAGPAGATTHLFSFWSQGVRASWSSTNVAFRAGEANWEIL